MDQLSFDFFDDDDAELPDSESMVDLVRYFSGMSPSPPEPLSVPALTLVINTSRSGEQ